MSENKVVRFYLRRLARRDRALAVPVAQRSVRQQIDIEAGKFAEFRLRALGKLPAKSWAAVGQRKGSDGK